MAGVPDRGSIWSEQVERLRTAAATEPGRLRIIGAALALLIAAFGAVTAWQTSERADAAEQVVQHSQPLSADAADIYRLLADANTSESSGFLAGGQEPQEIRDTYARDIATAADKLTKAAANAQADPKSAEAIAELNRLLPRYTGYVERARANNRSGLPLGAAYLRLANDLMQKQMLVQAQRLYQNENERLHADYDDATTYPWVAISVGTVTLGALVWAQRRTYQRTNRVFNTGLLAATAATAVMMLWLVVGHTMARVGLNDSYDHGVRSLNVLDDARNAALRARSNENLTLISRGADTVKVGKKKLDKYDHEFNKEMAALGGTDGTGGLLGRAAALADDAAGRAPVVDAVAQVKVWKARHKAARASDDKGNYADALSKIVGVPDRPSAGNTSGAAFKKVDDALGRALTRERAEFTRSAKDGQGALWGLPMGAAALAVLGAVATLGGIGSRLSEYR